VCTLNSGCKKARLGEASHRLKKTIELFRRHHEVTVASHTGSVASVTTDCDENMLSAETACVTEHLSEITSISYNTVDVNL
jgi:hypothetical protein